MVDTMTPVDPAPAPEPQPSGARAFLASTMGKLVIGGLLLLLVFGAIGVALVMFVFSAVDDMEIIVTSPVPAGTGTGSGIEPVEPPPLPLEQVFTFRDIFDPLIKPTPVQATTSSPDATGTPAPADVPQDTVYLQDIVTEDGESVAVLLYNGQTYRLTEGERVADSPWQVLEIRTDSVVMLYGETRVTLTIGQGISK